MNDDMNLKPLMACAVCNYFIYLKICFLLKDMYEEVNMMTAITLK